MSGAGSGSTKGSSGVEARVRTLTNGGAINGMSNSCMIISIYDWMMLRQISSDARMRGDGIARFNELINESLTLSKILHIIKNCRKTFLITGKYVITRENIALLQTYAGTKTGPDARHILISIGIITQTDDPAPPDAALHEAIQEITNHFLITNYKIFQHMLTYPDLKISVRNLRRLVEYDVYSFYRDIDDQICDILFKLKTIIEDFEKVHKYIIDFGDFGGLLRVCFNTDIFKLENELVKMIPTDIPIGILQEFVRTWLRMKPLYGKPSGMRPYEYMSKDEDEKIHELITPRLPDPVVLWKCIIGLTLEPKIDYMKHDGIYKEYEILCAIKPDARIREGIMPNERRYRSRKDYLDAVEIYKARVEAAIQDYQLTLGDHDVIKVYITNYLTRNPDFSREIPDKIYIAPAPAPVPALIEEEVTRLMTPIMPDRALYWNHLIVEILVRAYNSAASTIANIFSQYDIRLLTPDILNDTIECINHMDSINELYKNKLYVLIKNASVKIPNITTQTEQENEMWNDKYPGHNKSIQNLADMLGCNIHIARNSSRAEHGETSDSISFTSFRYKDIQLPVLDDMPAHIGEQLMNTYTTDDGQTMHVPVSEDAKDWRNNMTIIFSGSADKGYGHFELISDETEKTQKIPIDDDIIVHYNTTQRADFASYEHEPTEIRRLFAHYDAWLQFFYNNYVLPRDPSDRRERESKTSVPSTGRSSGPSVPSTGRSSETSVPSTGRPSGSSVPSTGRPSGSSVPSTGRPSGPSDSGITRGVETEHDRSPGQKRKPQDRRPSGQAAEPKSSQTPGLSDADKDKKRKEKEMFHKERKNIDAIRERINRAINDREGVAFESLLAGKDVDSDDIKEIDELKSQLQQHNDMISTLDHHIKAIEQELQD